MISISILTLKNSRLASIADAQFVFTKVNEFLIQKGKAPMFEVKLVGLSKQVSLNGGLFSIQTEMLLSEVNNTNLVIIPALMGDMMSATHLNREYGDWIARMYKDGAEVASLCNGAFLLAFSGLLKGKQCTTHWHYANEFKHYYPNVKLVDEKVITHQHGLYSSGGCNSYWNLLLHLVEKYAGREIAIYTAKYFVVDLDKDDQSPFIIFQGLRDHEDQLIKDTQDYIEHHYADRITVDQIADLFHMTRRTFERRFKKATLNTVTEYLQRVKVEAAKKQFEIGRKSISEVMGEIGYTDMQTFRDVFKKITGMTPVDYKYKYTKGKSKIPE